MLSCNDTFDIHYRPMHYDLIIKGFRTRNGRMVVARHLARNEGITLEEATARTDHLPITLVRVATRETIGAHLDRYSRHGIDAQAVPSDHAADPSGGDAASPDRCTGSLTQRRSNVSEIIPAAVTSDADAPSRSKKRLAPAVVKGTILYTALLAIIGAGILLGKNGGCLSDRTAPSNDPKTAGLVRKGDVPALHNKKPWDNDAGRATSFLYIDSAKASADDALSAIKFYKLALAFNRHNVHAWYGLLDVYRATGRTKEVLATTAEMRRTLGEGVFSIEAIVQPFGALLDYRRESDGSVAIEYQTKTDNEREKLLRETYLVARAVKSQCNCLAISIFAKTSRSRGLRVRIAASEPLASIADFEARARIQFLGKTVTNR
ncbi:MAG: hypothetical protein JW768_12105 [Chitinispirillaceae bacterium]|nr:hypothetical protein [Chitinispirillaceae bacterium]